MTTRKPKTADERRQRRKEYDEYLKSSEHIERLEEQRKKLRADLKELSKLIREEQQYAGLCLDSSLGYADSRKKLDRLPTGKASGRAYAGISSPAGVHGRVTTSTPKA